MEKPSQIHACREFIKVKVVVEGGKEGLISSLSRIKTFFLFKASNNDAIRGCFVDGCVRHGFFPNGESASLLC